MGGALTLMLGRNGIAGAAYDSASKSASITLSNSNYTATKSGTGLGGAKTTFGKKTGKYYFEGILTTRVASSTASEVLNAFGLARVDAGYAAQAVYGYAVAVYVNYTVNGNLWVDRTSQAALGVPSSGDRYGIAVDLTNSLVWVRRGTGNWNNNGSANPASGIGGFSLGDLAGYALTPFTTFYNNTEAFTLATSPGDIVNGVPSGFTTGWPSSGAQDNSGLGYTTFDSVKNASITLSNGGLTATRTTNGTIAKGRDSKSEGKQYVEFTIGQLTGANDGCGAADLDASYTDVGANGTKCCFIFKSGNIWTGGSNTGTSLGAVANGNIISLAIDWANLKFWFRKNGGNWNNSGSADPATNVGGIAFVNTTPVPGGGGNYAGRAMVPAATFGGTGSASGDNVTMNAGASAFTYSVPSGFESGWDREGNP